MKFPSVLVVIILMLGTLMLPAMSQVQNNSTFQLPHGDWVIGPGESITVDGETIYLNGNLTVKKGGSLTLKDSKLIMNSTYSGEYRITVEEGGNLNIVDSEVSAPQKDYKGKITYHIHRGINLISIPFQTDNHTAESVLSPFNGTYYKAYLYNSSDKSDPWKFYFLEGEGHEDEIPSHTWKFHTENISQPHVYLTIPENRTENISVEQKIFVIFDKRMDTRHTPTLRIVSGNDTGGWRFEGWKSTISYRDTAVWSHNPFSTGDLITFEISDYEDSNGIIGKPYRWTVRTYEDSSSTVLYSNPDIYEKGLNSTGSLSIRYRSSLNSSITPQIDVLYPKNASFTFYKWDSYNPNRNVNDTTIWNYSAPPSSPVIFSVSNYKTLSGKNGTTYYGVFFTRDTVAPKPLETSPVNGDKYVQADSLLKVVFDESMNSSSEPMISQSSGDNPDEWRFLGWESTYLPSDTAVWYHSPWRSFENITIMIYNYTDAAGNLGRPYTWSFRTGDSRAPGVIKVVPENLESSSPLDSEVRVVFNSTMNTRVIPHIEGGNGNWSFIGWESTYRPYDTAVWRHSNWTSDSDMEITIREYSDMPEIYPLQALVLYSDRNSTVQISGTVSPYFYMNMKKGWNLFPYPFIDNSTVNDVFSSISGCYDSIKTYGDLGNVTYMNNESEVRAGTAYWVHMINNCSLYLSAYSILDVDSIFPKFIWIYENGSTGNIDHSVVSGCGYGEYPGITIFSDLVKVSGTEIRDSDTGIYVRNSSPIVTSNKIHDTYYGIVSESASPIISNNRIYKNRADAIHVDGGYPIISSNNISSSTKNGIFISNSTSIIEGNAISTSRESGISVYNSTIKMYFSHIYSNKKGIYSVHSNISIQKSSISGNDIGIIASHSSVKIEYNTFSINRNGIIIDNGTKGLISNNSMLSSDRISIYCKEGSSPMIYGNIIVSGDIGILASGSKPPIEKNIISGNAGSGIQLQNSADSWVKNNVITGNGWAGVYIDSSSPILENNTFERNDFGVAAFNSSAKILNNSIEFNRWYGLSLIHSDIFVENTKLMGNKWYGILTSYSSFVLQNVSIFNSTYQLYLTHYSNGDSVNSTIDGEACHIDSSSVLYVKYFLNIRVNDTRGNGINNASFTIKDRDGYIVKKGLVRYGLAPYIPLTSYVMMFGGRIDMENPYNLTVEWNNRSFSREFHMNSTVMENFTFPAVNYSVKEDCGNVSILKIHDWLPKVVNGTFYINASNKLRAHIYNGKFFINPVKNWNGVENITITEIKDNKTVAAYSFALKVIPVNDAPVLEGEGPAYSSDRYTVFRITYFDADNDPPKYVKVVIDGKSYDMIPENPYDYNYTDGKVYVYRAELKDGTYTYHFECSDGKNLTVTKDFKLKVETSLSVPMWIIYALLFVGLLLVFYVGVRIRKLKKMVGEDIDITISDEERPALPVQSTIDSRRAIWKKKHGADSKFTGIDRGSKSQSVLDKNTENVGAEKNEVAEAESSPQKSLSEEQKEVSEQPAEGAVALPAEEATDEEKKRKYTKSAFMEMARKHRKMRVLIEDMEKYAKLEPEVDAEERKTDESVEDILKALKGE